ncbi:BURP domain-containing protein 6 [Curcuma longa]|uniref:BURP domain-containing protein 6 n=1 Tax=Curcuma longa TaxID=136217 RepID=UPI003D9EA656
MDRLFVLLPLLSFFLLLGAASDAAVSPQEAYWRTVLPSTPMPSAIADRLSLAATVGSEKTSVSVGKGGVHVNTGKPGRGTTVNVGGGGVHVNTKKPGGGTSVNVGHGGGVHVGTGKPGGGGTTVNVGHGGVHVGTGKPGGGGTTVNVGHGGVGPSKGQPPVREYSFFVYRYAATETQIHDDPNVALFFLESNLRTGAAMTVHFTRPSAFRAAFLPRREADAIPFSSARLPEILDRLSIKPGSPEAETTLSTLQECERPAAPGERKLCATSLESMVDFSVANLGTRRVVAASTSVSKAGTPRQMYTIEGVRKAVAAEGKLVACHAEKYAYAVFYCHTSAAARAYTVSLVGADGAKVEAVAVCHTDTAGWNPNHVAFKALKVSPGTVPVCHYLPEDHLVWSRSN